MARTEALRRLGRASSCRLASAYARQREAGPASESRGTSSTSAGNKSIIGWRPRVAVFRRNQTCVDCHFFVKTTRLPGAAPYVKIVSPSERDEVREGDFNWVEAGTALSCHLGVWDEGGDFQPGHRTAVIVETSRRAFCFFWSLRHGMFLPAAKILQEREARLRETKRDRRLTLLGLWIAAVALASNVVLTVANVREWWPF